MKELERDEFIEDLKKCAIDLKAYPYLTMAYPLAFLTRKEKKSMLLVYHCIRF